MRFNLVERTAMEAAEVIPMFPLQNVVVPGADVLVHVFEPRYRRLLVDLSERYDTFGIVLVVRGSEVGGGDERAHVGTRCRITGVTRLGSGGFVVSVRGLDRIRVETWLPDDPYPVAVVEPFPLAWERLASSPSIVDLEHEIRDTVWLGLEAGQELSPVVLDPRGSAEERLWALLAGAPIAMIDRQRLLELEEGSMVIEQLLAELAAVREVFWRLIVGGEVP
ncbi:MAG: LON peptidase substrate-binding domain-containing protein [Ferrimicrobium sp.]